MEIDIRENLHKYQNTREVWYTEVSREPRIICLRHGDTIQTDIPKVSVPQESGPARQAGLFRLYNS